jgi:hypothetical protein
MDTTLCPETGSPAGLQGALRFDRESEDEANFRTRGLTTYLANPYTFFMSRRSVPCQKNESKLKNQIERIEVGYWRVRAISAAARLSAGDEKQQSEDHHGDQRDQHVESNLPHPRRLLVFPIAQFGTIRYADFLGMF